MNTSHSTGKRYFVDGKREDEVKLIDPLPEIQGYVKVKFKTGQIVNLEEDRLTEIVEVPIYFPNEDADIDLEYPQKVSKITMEIFDAETGEVFTKWLEGGEAQKWNAWMRELCYKAELIGINPKWLSLKWNAKRTKK